MYDRRLATKFNIVDFVCCGPGLGPSQELNVESYGVWLVLLRQSCAEMCFDYLQYANKSRCG